MASLTSHLEWVGLHVPALGDNRQSLSSNSRLAMNGEEGVEAVVLAVVETFVGAKVVVVELSLRHVSMQAASVSNCNV